MTMWKQIFLDTIYVPRVAAQRLLALGLSVSESWTFLALASVLNAIAFYATILMFPPLESATAYVIVSPLAMSAVLFGVMSLGATTLFWAGRTMGGAARFTDLLVLVTWLQFMRLAIQVAGFLLMPIVPGLANSAMFVASLYGLWILVNFINEAQGYDSIGKSTGNLFLSFVGLMVVLSIFFSIIGLSTVG